MKPGDLAIVASPTLCYKTSQAGKSLSFGASTSYILSPGDFAVIVGEEEKVRFEGRKNDSLAYEIALVLCLCKFGLVSLNPFSLVVFNDW